MFPIACRFIFAPATCTRQQDAAITGHRAGYLLIACGGSKQGLWLGVAGMDEVEENEEEKMRAEGFLRAVACHKKK